MEPQHDEIAKLAYQFYLEDGRPEGRSDEFWARAEEFLRHPENHSGTNVLAVPSEPEITPALDQKGRELDANLPSNPRTGGDAVHQRVELAVDPKKKREEIKKIERTLKKMKGIEKIEPEANASRVLVYFDARQTNPAAIHEAVFDRGGQTADASQR